MKRIRNTVKSFRDNQATTIAMIDQIIKKEGYANLKSKAYKMFETNGFTFSKQHVETALNQLFPKKKKVTKLKREEKKGFSFDGIASIMEDLSTFDPEAIAKIYGKENPGSPIDINLKTGKASFSGTQNGAYRAEVYA